MTYPDPRVVSAAEEFCVSFRGNVKERTDLVRKLRIQWAPTILFLDGERWEHHRIDGFLPPEEYAPQTCFAAGKTAFDHGQYDTALDRFRKLIEFYPDADCAPMAMYWQGVCEHRRSGKADGKIAVWKKLNVRYSGSIWAKKVKPVIGDKS